MERSERHPEKYIETREHYTYLINILIDAYNAGKLPEIKNIIIEPEYGYVASIEYNSGEYRILYGHDPGFNSGSAEQLANDKGYTKFLLRENGINCARGGRISLALVGGHAASIRSSAIQSRYT